MRSGGGDRGSCGSQRRVAGVPRVLVSAVVCQLVQMKRLPPARISYRFEQLLSFSELLFTVLTDCFYGPSAAVRIFEDRRSAGWDCYLHKARQTSSIKKIARRCMNPLLGVNSSVPHSPQCISVELYHASGSREQWRRDLRPRGAWRRRRA